tara:strand:+ start:80 stop:520 length:441 start_codon:yes stop_codon:yes gene_type:complete
MKISKSDLALLIETYLHEQEEESSKKSDGDDQEGIDWEEATFQLEIDGDKKDISFFEDEANQKVNYKVDGESLGNRTTANFATIGSLATLSDKIEVQKAGEALAKLDKNLKNKPLDRIQQLVQQKMKTEKFPLSLKDIRSAVQPRE